jgi:hypothetical protein
MLAFYIFCKIHIQQFTLQQKKTIYAPADKKKYGRHHDLVDRYGISVSQMTTDMFHFW